MAARFSVRGALGSLLLAHALAQAQPATVSEESAGRPATVENDGLVALLEFIGEFTTDDGEWVDPEILLETESGRSGRRLESGTRDEDGESAERVEPCRDSRCE